jgi:hypothetical protein
MKGNESRIGDGWIRKSQAPVKGEKETKMGKRKWTTWRVIGVVVVMALVVIRLWNGRAEARSEGASPAATSPVAAVEGFYGWYLGYMGDPMSNEWRNPLADGAYRESEFLAPELVATVDSMQPFMFDPFLCAQDVPTEITVGEAEVNGGVARVAVTSSFVGHGFTVELTEGAGGWQIVDVICR